MTTANTILGFSDGCAQIPVHPQSARAWERQGLIAFPRDSRGWRYIDAETMARLEALVVRRITRGGPVTLGAKKAKP